MAKVKKSIRTLRQEARRTTWTPFQVDQSQDSTNWTASHYDTYLRPVIDIAGWITVRIGIKVESPEQAVLIILWDSWDSLRNFQESPACGETLRLLGYADSSPLRFLSLQWDIGFCLGDNDLLYDGLHGRVTLTTLTLPSLDPSHSGREKRQIYEALAEFRPRACKNGLAARAFDWWAFTWVKDDNEQTGEQLQQLSLTESSQQKQATCYAFFRWNGNGATPEMEEMWARNPEDQVTWAQTVEALMPKPMAWETERWDIRLVSRRVNLEGDRAH